MMRLSAARPLLAAGLLLLANPAGAAPPTPAVTAAREAAALLAKGKAREACPLFAESVRLDPLPATKLSLARCLEKAGRPGAALVVYRELASDKALAPRLAAASAVRALEARLPKLVVNVDLASAPPDLEIVRDGVSLDRSEWNRPVSLDRGKTTITAAARGKKTWSQTLDIDKGVLSVRVPALENDVSAVAAHSTALVAIQAVGSARWNDGIGFVIQADEPRADTASPPPAVPVIEDQDLGRVAWSPPSVGAGAALTDLGQWAVRATAHVRADFRRRTSWVAPWFDLEVHGGYFPYAESGFVGGGAHFGVDIHPARQTWVGFGPFIGGQVLGFVGNYGSFSGGPELGMLNLHFRTSERDGRAPTFDANAYVVERISVDPLEFATYTGLRLGVGGSVRFRAYVEGRVATGETRADLFWAQLVFGGGLYFEH